MKDFEKLIGAVSVTLRSVLVRDELVHACQQGRYDDRVFYYEDIVRRAYASCFRVYDGCLYWFSGRIWEELSDVLLYNGMRDAIVGIASEFYPSIRSDIGRCLGRILSKLSPSCCVVLDVRNSVVGFRNCVVDFTDVYSPVVHDFCDRLPVLWLLDYDYDVDAVCPVWESFLSQMLSRSQRLLLHKFLGLGVVDRRGLGIEKTLWLIGTGANGKSTIQGVVQGVFGSERVSCIRLDDLLNRRPDERMRSTKMIMGKVFNYSNEVHEADINRSTDTFKALVSGDKQAVRQLGRDIVMSDRVPYLICNMNKRPEMKNMDKAIVRRLLQINFRAAVSEDDMDLDLGEKLRSEYSGIFNWMVEGYKMLVADGYRFSDEDTEGENQAALLENGRTLDAYLNAMGIRDWVRKGRLDEEPRWVLSTHLYLQYKLWCLGHDLEPETVASFGRQMHSRFKFTKRNVGVVYAVYCDGDLPKELRC